MGRVLKSMNNSQYKKHILSTGKEIHIYDGLVPLSIRDHVFVYVSSSKYMIGWKDGLFEDAVRHKYLFSSFSEQDNDECRLLPFLKITAVGELIKDLTLTKSVVNLSTPSDTHFAHVHPEKLVVLYYANMKWEQHWHGETLFYTEDLNEIELAIRYQPGRVIVFDASIPHAIRPQSVCADHFRFTCAFTFN
jgi:hypothetical protein